MSLNAWVETTIESIVKERRRPAMRSSPAKKASKSKKPRAR
jgi:hypothetical protein